MTESLTNHLMAREQERCRCLMKDDIDGLRKLLSQQLIHVHTKGNAHNLNEYLRFVQEVAQVITLERGELTIRQIGDNAAVMLGRQTNRSRGRASAATMTIEAQVVQIWTREDDGEWRISVFQGTPIPGEQKT